VDERNLRLAEAWLLLLAEAVRGTREARETIRGLAERALAPEEIVRRIAAFLPSGVTPPPPEVLGQWLEGFWTATGVVPRARYEELLERYDAMRARLEEAEVTIQRLRKLAGNEGQPKEQRKLLDLWADTVEETFKTQADWMRSWLEGPGDDEKPRPPKKTASRSRRPRRRKPPSPV
jgi:hypothetical protein